MTTPLLRPEMAAWLRRWRETLASVAVAAVGAWWFARAGGVLAWVGVVLAVAGAAAAFAAVQRARFRPAGGGVGVVQLDEGRLTYFGPLSGGSMAVDGIETVGIDPRHKPAHWVLSGIEGDLLIPVDAEGAEALFDVFAQLPGLDLQAVLAANGRKRSAPATLWRRRGRVAAARRISGPRV